MIESIKYAPINKRKIAVVAPEKRLRSALSRYDGVAVVNVLDKNQLQKWSDIFVLVSMSDLQEISGLITEANKINKVRGIFVEIGSDGQKDVLPQFLSHIRYRSIRKLLVHSGSEIPNRVLNAFSIGAEKELIAYAVAVGEDLFVINCALESFQLSFDSIRALKHMSSTERSCFSVAVDGSHMHWAAGDIHLNLNSIKSILDPSFRARQIAEMLESYASTGDAVKRLRLEFGLKQPDIHGMSERQIRRIEKGNRLTLASASDLAAAHGMDVDTYLDRIAALSIEDAGRRPSKAPIPA